jgi:transposase-like protein
VRWTQIVQSLTDTAGGSTVSAVSSTNRERRLTQARSSSVIKSLHVRGLAEAGAARAVALEEADRQLDRIARLLHDALQGGVSITEVARVTGVSRQTLYELRGRYGDTVDLRFAVLQSLATQGGSTVGDVAEHVRRPVAEVEALLAELIDQGLAGWELGGDDVRFTGGDFECYLTMQGLRALEEWSFTDGSDG